MAKIFPLAFISDDVIPDWVSHLGKKKDVIAPHKSGIHSFSFEKVSNPNHVILNYNRTLSSIKKYFLPPKETLFSFSTHNHVMVSENVEPVNSIFLGVHNYDLQALFRLDHNFSTGNPESQYLTRRKDSIFIGIAYNPDKWHFSESVLQNGSPNNSNGFDLFVHPIDNGYILETLTENGKNLISDYPLEEYSDIIPPSPKQKHKINEMFVTFSHLFSKSWLSPVWEKYAEKCVGCGTCNLVCPTCFCFDVKDEMELDLVKGKRVRIQDGCMLRSFSEVAGGEIFRDQKAARMRHRLYRKFKYISDETNESWCVGCGRCSAYCTAGISIVDIVNDLILESNAKEI